MFSHTVVGFAGPDDAQDIVTVLSYDPHDPHAVMMTWVGMGSEWTVARSIFEDALRNVPAVSPVGDIHVRNGEDGYIYVALRNRDSDPEWSPWEARYPVHGIAYFLAGCEKIVPVEELDTFLLGAEIDREWEFANSGKV